jgi:predicted nucleic acid-binding protein
VLVLDCSVLMAWVVPDETSDYANKVRDIITQDNISIAVPPLFLVEVMNVGHVY